MRNELNCLRTVSTGGLLWMRSWTVRFDKTTVDVFTTAWSVVSIRGISSCHIMSVSHYRVVHVFNQDIPNFKHLHPWPLLLWTVDNVFRMCEYFPNCFGNRCLIRSIDTGMYVNVRVWYVYNSDSSLQYYFCLHIVSLNTSFNHLIR